MLNLVSPRLSSRLTPLALLALSALLLCSAALAQTSVSNGSVSGTVTDDTGAVVPNAKVTMIGPTGQTIHATTSGQGAYSSGALIPGKYSVRVEAKGFKTTQMLVDVQVNNTANGSVKLAIGQESTVVEVQSSEVAVNTEQAEVQGVLTASQISTLPVNGRNFLDLAQLEPGVQIQDGENFDPTKVGYSSISFGGRFGRTARINVDGVDVSDETVGTTTEDIPASSIQEFSLAQSSLDLSNDLTSSGAVNVTTKSGTDNYHGEAFGFFRDSAVGAANLPSPINPQTGQRIAAPWQRNQEGGNIGGPIIKDKLFFFMDGERTLQHQAAPVLDAAPFSTYSGTFPAPFKEDELTARLDYNLTKTARLFGRYNYFQNSVYATFFPGSFSVYNNKDYTRNLVAGLDFNTGSVTHTIRFSYLKFQNQIADAVTGSDLPFANLGINMAIGSFATGPNDLAPQSTPQSDHQLKYDGSRVIGKHILRFGGGWNHIQGGGFASFFGIAPLVNGTTGPQMPAGALAGNPLADTINSVVMSNGQGYSTTEPALGFPAGGLGPDNRISLYIGDSWKVRTNLTVALGLRWERDTGRTDSDLGAIAPINQFFPGHGNSVNNPNRNFAPQLGIAWDPKGDGKTVIRGGIGLYYENVIFNNVLFDRPARLQNGAFLQIALPCANGQAFPVGIAGGGSITVGNDPAGNNACADTIGNAASTLAAFEKQFQAANPFSLTNPNPSYIGNYLSAGANVNAYANNQGLFDSNYVSPRAVQMNFGVQHEIRHGMVFSADFLRNVETHALLAVDLNHAGDISNFNVANAAAAISATETAFGHAGDLQGTIGAGAKIGDFVANGMGSPLDAGGACACAFTGTNPALGQFYMLEPVSRSVYNALQMKLTQNVTNPAPGLKAANFQIGYSLSKFVNPLAFAGVTPPSNPVAGNDQDFVLTAVDSDQPLRFMGPSLLDRTQQLSFGGNFDLAHGFRLGVIGHFYSPLSMATFVGNTGTPGQIYQTDFTGTGLESQPMPGTTNGSFMRQFGVTGLNNAIDNYNLTQGNQPTPAGQKLVTSGLFTVAQMQQIGAVAPVLNPAPANQLIFPWVRALDLRASWLHHFGEQFTIEPSIGFYNVANFSNFNQPPGAMTGFLNEGSGSINSIVAGSQSAQTFRVGAGTGVFGMGAPRVLEFGMRLTF
ncbi:MAG: carboxypeptidase regulatory-like domain-containing protein [Candidatus Sulfotelmatobacter sp.]